MAEIIEWPLSIPATSNAARTVNTDARATYDDDEVEAAQKVWQILQVAMKTLEHCIKSVDEAVAAIADPARRESLERNILLIRTVILHSSKEMTKAARVPLVVTPDNSGIVA